MSFSFSFTAADKFSAQRKLHEAYAPASVKAVIEKAIDALPVKAATQASSSAKSDSAGTGSGGYRPPVFIGVFVEAHGHIDESGTNESGISRLVVKPLFD